KAQPVGPPSRSTTRPITTATTTSNPRVTAPGGRPTGPAQGGVAAGANRPLNTVPSSGGAYAPSAAAGGLRPGVVPPGGQPSRLVPQNGLRAPQPGTARPQPRPQPRQEPAGKKRPRDEQP